MALPLCLGVIDGDQIIYLFQHPFIHDLIQHPLAALFVIYLHLLLLLCFANCCAHFIFPSLRRQCNLHNSIIRLLFCSMMLQIIACGFCVLQKRPFFRVFCPSLLFIVFLLFFIVFPFCPFYYSILSGIILLLLKSIFFFINIGFLWLPVSLVVNGLPLFRVVSSRHIVGLLFLVDYAVGRSLVYFYHKKFRTAIAFLRVFSPRSAEYPRNSRNF